jgi:hypothetical protein
VGSHGSSNARVWCCRSSTKLELLQAQIIVLRRSVEEGRGRCREHGGEEKGWGSGALVIYSRECPLVKAISVRQAPGKSRNRGSEGKLWVAQPLVVKVGWVRADRERWGRRSGG